MGRLTLGAASRWPCRARSGAQHALTAPFPASEGTIAPLDTSSKTTRFAQGPAGTAPADDDAAGRDGAPRGGHVSGRPGVAWPSAPPRLLCVGLSTVDELWRVERFPPVGSRTPATDHASWGGGPAANAAVAAARLGAEVSLWSNLGDDPAGDLALRELAELGVDTRAVRRIEAGRTAVSAVLVNPAGERFIFPFFGDGLRDATAVDFPVADIERADCVLVDLRLPELTRDVLTRAAAAGVPSVGDVSNTRNLELTERLDHLIASQECAADVLGRDDPTAALAALRRRPDQVVGVTLGERGVVLDDGTGPHMVAAFPVAALDTTGAGDVFHGAYAFGIACGWDPLGSARVAAATAALACTGFGRAAIPSGDQVRELLAKSGNNGG